MSLEQKIPDSIIVIPHTHPLRWIMMFYALPKEMFEKLPEYRQMPRNMRPIQISEKYMRMINCDDFLIMVWSLYAWTVWHCLRVPGKNGEYRPIPGAWQHYSEDFPIWRITYEIGMHFREIFEHCSTVPVHCALRGALRAARWNRGAPRFQHQGGKPPCADSIGYPPSQRTCADEKGRDPIPCPHFSISITSRGRNESAMAGASYYLGQKLYSEYDHEWKYPHSDPKRVRYTEVMLPSNAPPEFADRQTLWNSVDVAEKRRTAQTARRFTIALPKELTFEQNLALIRDYCTKQFVDKGMVCDLYYHDSGNGNPHVHLMLTMRAMDEQGRWLPKAKTAYVLDENGERIRGANGRWLRERIDTVDWNDQKYAEIWRHEWELAQNNALEAAGHTQRIDMRSYERQGITDLEPQIHLGPEAAALERKGIPTTRGERNREIKRVNVIIASLQKTIAALGEWLHSIKETLTRHETISNPDDYNLGEVLLSYLDLRKVDREFWAHRAQTKASLKDLQAVHNAITFLQARKIDTVHALGSYLSSTGIRMNELRSVPDPSSEQYTCFDVSGRW